MGANPNPNPNPNPNALAGAPVHKWEHVERYSSRLLTELDAFLQRGAAGFGKPLSSALRGGSVRVWAREPKPEPWHEP